MLEFTDKTARILEDAYQGFDITGRRRANFAALDPRRGQHLLDLGCGNGLLTVELSRAVGPEGRVTGLDPSADMLKSARARCDGRENVSLMEGTAETIPLDDASLDGAVAVQVFEYISDYSAVLGEVHRVLRPGGRLVIGDLDLGTLVWHSDDRPRMQRMLDAWSRHFVEPGVPQILPGHLGSAGFELDEVIPAPVVDIRLKPDGLASMMMRLMTAFAIKNSLMERADADAWHAEQVELAATGRFFFAITHFVCVARRS